MATGSTWGYVKSEIDKLHEDYKNRYANNVQDNNNDQDNKKIKLDDKYWQECYVDQLKKNGRVIDATQFVALEFLQWAIDGISKNNSEIIYVPAIDEFYRNVNKELRLYLGKMMANQNDSFRYGLMVVPSIDWSKSEDYRRFSTTQPENQRQFQYIGRILADEVLHEPEMTDVNCQYIIHGSSQDIIGVNYHFTPSA